jgi:cation diffusion facilitator CzcD-associated flavoprotein CzcO
MSLTRSCRRVSVGIIGSGFAGIAAAIALTRAGFGDDLLILEKADDIGGVWRDNTYPGATCDIPSVLYCFSFAPNPAWRSRYAVRGDIHGYLKRTAAAYGIDRRIRLGTEVTAAEFDPADGRWLICCAGGEVVEADVLIAAVGQLSRPVMPDLPGAETFSGRSFHSARWDHGCGLAGKRVAVIGTGASAAQFIPRIQPVAEHLTIFQRSAPYVLPKLDRGYRGSAPRRLLSLSHAASRMGYAALFELLTLGLITDAGIPIKAMTQLARHHLRRQVADPALRAALTPDYRMGCKRVLLSDDYYPAVASSNVRLVTEPVTGITPAGLRAADGVTHPVDVIIYGTGFAATEFLAPLSITGLGGQRLADTWATGARGHLGMTVPGFPSMFMMYGPNTNLGAGSIVSMIQPQARYIAQAVRLLGRTGAAYLDVRSEAADRFEDEMRRRLARSTWSGCRSWYRDPAGRVATNWPGTVAEYARRTRTLSPGDFQLAGPAGAGNRTAGETVPVRRGI